MTTLNSKNNFLFDPVKHPRLSGHLLLWAIVIFIIYGSLFPFNFRETPLSIDVFYYQYNIFSNIPDAIDNFLLFFPLGFAIVYCYSTTRAHLIAAIGSISFLAIGIQLIQLYLPSRTASISDTFWNIIGMASGMLSSQIIQVTLRDFFSTSDKKHDRYAILLMLLWFCYESFPFIPTLDIGLLKDHIKTIVVAPSFEMMRFFQHSIAATLGSIAVMRSNLLKSKGLNIIAAFGLAVILEIFVAYGSLRRETLLGIFSGFMAGYYFEMKYAKNFSRTIFFLALSAYLLTVLTPYRDQSIGIGFTWTPFSHFLWQNITKDIPPSAFEALAIGSLFWAILSDKLRLIKPPIVLISGMIVLLVILEIWRIYIAEFHGDTTPLVMAILLSPFALTLIDQPGMRLQLQPADPHRRVQTDANDVNTAPDATLVSSKSKKNQSSQWIYYLYISSVFIFIIYIITTGNTQSIKPQWLAYWGFGLSLLFVATKFPITGVISYIIVGYGISSNGPEYDISLALGLRDGIAALALAAWMLEKHVSGRAFQLWKLLPFTVISFFVWLLLCMSIAWIKGTPWGPILRFSPSIYIHAAVMFVLVADLIRDKIYHVGLALLIICTTLGRALLQGLDGVYLESYVATLLVMGLPIAGIGILISNKISLRIGFGIIAAAMLFFLVATQNRNAAVAFLAVVLIFILQLHLMWIKKVIILGIVPVVIALTMPMEYYSRFSALWDFTISQSTSGLDRATAESRLMLWRSAWEITKDYPVFGAGPGNFAYFLQFYSLGQGRLGAHNSYLQALAETGFIGLFLYLALFISAYLLLFRIRQNRAATWHVDVASMLQLSLIAYFALGLFNNRNDLVLAYIVAGWAVALKFSLPATATGSSMGQPLKPANS